MIVPVAVAQVGCVRVTDGAAGATGGELMVALVPDDIHPNEFFAVAVYVPVATPLKIPVVFV